MVSAKSGSLQKLHDLFSQIQTNLVYIPEKFLQLIRVESGVFSPSALYTPPATSGRGSSRDPEKPQHAHTLFPNMETICHQFYDLAMENYVVRVMIFMLFKYDHFFSRRFMK